MKHYVLVEIRTAQDAEEDSEQLLKALRRIRRFVHEVDVPGVAIADGVIREDRRAPFGTAYRSAHADMVALFARLLPKHAQHNN